MSQMNTFNISKTTDLCDLIILKTVAIKEKLHSNPSLGVNDTKLLIALYCRELLIINREIESINQAKNLS